MKLGTNHPSTYSIPTSITLGLVSVILALNLMIGGLIQRNGRLLRELHGCADDQRAAMKIVAQEHFDMHQKLNQIMAQYEASTILHGSDK